MITPRNLQTIAEYSMQGHPHGRNSVKPGAKSWERGRAVRGKEWRMFLAYLAIFVSASTNKHFNKKSDESVKVRELIDLLLQAKHPQKKNLQKMDSVILFGIYIF